MSLKTVVPAMLTIPTPHHSYEADVSNMATSRHSLPFDCEPIQKSTRMVVKKSKTISRRAHSSSSKKVWSNRELTNICRKMQMEATHSELRRRQLSEYQTFLCSGKPFHVNRRYTFLKDLGSGTYGSVALLRDNVLNRNVA